MTFSVAHPLAVVFAVSACLNLAFPQEYVPSEILDRTHLIRVGDTFGTIFSIDYDGMLYLVTARHVVANVPDKDAVLEIQKVDGWANVRTVRTLFPKSKEVDIAVFETGAKMPGEYLVTAKEKETAMMGQQIWFLGYPFGIGSHFRYS